MPIYEIISLISPIIGILFSLLLAIIITPRLINYSTKDIDDSPPKGVLPKEWIKTIKTNDNGGKTIGLLEILPAT